MDKFFNILLFVVVFNTRCFGKCVHPKKSIPENNFFIKILSGCNSKLSLVFRKFLITLMLDHNSFLSLEKIIKSSAYLIYFLALILCFTNKSNSCKYILMKSWLVRLPNGIPFFILIVL